MDIFDILHPSSGNIIWELNRKDKILLVFLAYMNMEKIEDTSLDAREINYTSSSTEDIVKYSIEMLDVVETLIKENTDGNT